MEWFKHTVIVGMNKTRREWDKKYFKQHFLIETYAKKGILSI